MTTISRRLVAVVRAVTAVSLCITLPPPPSDACINDRDSDAVILLQIRDLPPVGDVISGRFAQNPPLYYKMRIERITKELKTNPKKYALYDDIAAAYDGVGQVDTAIAWMVRKRQVLDKYQPLRKGVKPSDAWYRYYANIGTFRVHKWVAGGADRARISEMKQGRSEIARAIAINPEAHYGRELYQLQMMDWIIADGRVRTERTADTRVSLGNFIMPKAGKPVVDGLAGLIVLGNAWESVDLFRALADALVKKGDSSLASMAAIRAMELEKAGRVSLVTRSAGSKSPNAKAAKAYARQRLYAQAWQKERTDYMMARLTKGKHPDTDPTFWQNYKG